MHFRKLTTASTPSCVENFLPSYVTVSSENPFKSGQVFLRDKVELGHDAPRVATREKSNFSSLNAFISTRDRVSNFVRKSLHCKVQ